MSYNNWRDGLHDGPVGLALPDGVAAAAVLIVVTADDAPHLILTKRSAHLKKHAGQISFAGGRVDEDDESLVATAMREAHEEIGLASDDVTICGFLPDMLTGTGYRITPIVAQSYLSCAALQAKLQASPDEVDEILYAPISLLLVADNYDSFLREDENVTWRSWRVGFGDHFIWGATAAILHHWSRAL